MSIIDSSSISGLFFDNGAIFVSVVVASIGLVYYFGAAEVYDVNIVLRTP